MPLFPWLKKPKPVEPVTPPAPPSLPDEANPARAAWLKALMLLRSIDKQKLGVALFTAPVIAFFAISGAFLWLWVALRGLYRFVLSIFK
jgi:hypothetical protein